MKRSGWYGESKRHSEAKRFGRASPNTVKKPIYVVKSEPLYKMTNIKSIDEIGKDGTDFGWKASFATEVSSQHREFGHTKIVVDVDKLIKRGYTVIPVEYDFDWMKEHPDIMLSVTARDEDAWYNWVKKEFGDQGITEDNWEADEIISNEIESLYGWEKEVIVLGNPTVTLYPDDVISIEPEAEL